jgi:hypothetical protein
MHRRSLAWVLSLLLVFAQHGAVLHELGHLSQRDGTGGAALRADLHAPNSGLCPTCEAFAQVANPAAAAAHAVPVCPAAVLPIPDSCYAIVSADAPTPRSRGPPSA